MVGWSDIKAGSLKPNSGLCNFAHGHHGLCLGFLRTMLQSNHFCPIFLFLSFFSQESACLVGWRLSLSTLPPAYFILHCISPNIPLAYLILYRISNTWPSDTKNQLNEKDPSARKDWRQKKKGWQRMRWLDRITNSKDIKLSKLWEIVKNRWAWHPAVYRVKKSQTQLSDWTTTVLYRYHFQRELKVTS